MQQPMPISYYNVLVSCMYSEYAARTLLMHDLFGHGGTKQQFIIQTARSTIYVISTTQDRMSCFEFLPSPTFNTM